MCVCMCGCVNVCVCVLIKTEKEGGGERRGWGWGGEAWERQSSVPISKDLLMGLSSLFKMFPSQPQPSLLPFVNCHCSIL